MKRMLCFIAVMLLVAATAWAADYPVAHGANEQIAHATHYPKMVSVKGTQTPECKLENIATAPKCDPHAHGGHRATWVRWTFEFQ